MSKIDNLKDKCLKHTLSWEDMDWLFGRIEGLERLLRKQSGTYYKWRGELKQRIEELGAEVKELEAKLKGAADAFEEIKEMASSLEREIAEKALKQLREE